MAAVSSKPAQAAKTKTIEERYQKKTPIEHILHRPESYIGSVQPDSQTCWVWDEANQKMVCREIVFVPGLFKIFDEILVNAADVKAREENERRGGESNQRMTSLKVDIDRENGSISVFNDGEGIPIEIHQEHQVHVPELIFGHLLTSDNYDDTEMRVTGGRNGYGAKLTNIFSKMFSVECADAKRKRKFRKTWKDNMSKSDPCKIVDYKESKDYVKVTFTPDFHRLETNGLDDDTISLFTKRVYDIAGCCGVKVWLNGKRLPVDNFKSYVDLYFPPKELSLTTGADHSMIKIHEKVARWEVVVSMSEGQFQQVSFVNSICTSKGGTHVNYVSEPLVQAILKKVNTKNKGGMEIKPHHVRAHLWIFINCLIVNPTFDSQTKETLTLKASQFGSKFSPSEKTVNAIIKSDIVESVLLWARTRQQVELQKKLKGTTTKGGKDHVAGIPKLEDANDAGTKLSDQCTLILTEGESAKTSCVAGLSIVGKDKYGVFPLRGKLLNVRDATFKQQVDNAEIQAILKIMGLQVGKKFESPKGLRYGSLMIMADQDLDGSHIKGLLVNMVAHYWPALLQYPGFLREFVTPIVKVSKGQHELSFFTLSEYEKWKQQNNNGKGWKIRYYKGLGTSTDREFKEYFSDLERHSLDFQYTGVEDLDAIDMAFNGKRAEDRKQWIQQYNDRDYVDHSLSSVTYKDFINKELVAFSKYDAFRSIPNCIDGLKPVQRKVLFAAFKKNLKAELKVAQFIGYISEKTAYHHGEQSLGTTIIGMAQTFVGSNNINLFVPCGQFGSRKEGGKDASAVRYIFTRLSPLARAVFPEADDALLEYQNDDGLMVEPKYYIPVIPLVLVNGSEGIGTGWSSSIPNYNPRDVIQNTRRFMKGEPMDPMIPWFRGFKGRIERKGEGYESVGEILKLDDETVQITELPVKVWTQNFKTFVELLRVGNQNGGGQQADDSPSNERGKGRRGASSGPPFSITDYRDNCTHEDILFTIKMAPTTLARIEKEGLDKAFKLRKPISTTNMTLFDANLKVQRYASELDIIREFGSLRFQFYELRREYLIEKLERERRLLRNKVNFVEAIIATRLTVSNRKKSLLVKDLVEQGFDTITRIFSASTLMYKLEQQRAKIESELNVVETSEIIEEGETTISQPASQSEDTVVPAKEFEYLLGMAIWSLTAEKVEELRELLKKKADELEDLQRKTARDLWEIDLQNLEKALDDQDEMDRQEKEEHKKFKQKRRLSFSKPMKPRAKRPSAKIKSTKKSKDVLSDSESAALSDVESTVSPFIPDGLPPVKKAVPKRARRAKAKAKSAAVGGISEALSKESTTATSTTAWNSLTALGASQAPHTAAGKTESPKPLKGFSLAERIKTRTDGFGIAGAAGPKQQKTLDELLGLSSSISSSAASTPSPAPTNVEDSADAPSREKRAADTDESQIRTSPLKRPNVPPRRGRLRRPGVAVVESSEDSGSDDLPVKRKRRNQKDSSDSVSDDFDLDAVEESD